MMVLFLNAAAPAEIYTLSLHDALPTSRVDANAIDRAPAYARQNRAVAASYEPGSTFKPVTVSGALEERRSEEHTSELQSRQYLVCRLLLEKKTSPSPLKQRSDAADWLA